MRSFTCILLAILLVNVPICSSSKERQNNEEKRPSLMSQDIAKLKKEMANEKTVANKNRFHEKKSQDLREKEESYFDELPKEMVEGIRSIKNDHTLDTASKRVVPNKVKQEVQNENKKSASRKRKETALKERNLDLEGLPKEMKIAIESVKIPVLQSKPTK